MSDQELIQALIDERVRQGLSQREVSRRMGVSPASLCDWEQRKHSPMLDSLFRWSRALGLTLIIEAAPEANR